jgi:4-hydroxy-2-oxoheptanedioate aldolase
MLVGAQATGASALVRVRSLDDRTLTVALDAGADGVVLAGCQSAEQATGLVTAATYPPLGSRGYGRRRAAWRSSADATTTLVCQVESVDGVTATGDIAGVSGIDAVVVGLADLSFSLGCPLDFTSPVLRDAVSQVAVACREAGCSFGIAGPSQPEHLAFWMTLRPEVVMVGTDAQLLLAAARTAAAAVRGSEQGRS